MRGEILTHLERLAHPDRLDDEGVERLEETARHTRRLGIAGAKLGLATSADALLERFLPTIQQAIGRRPPGSSMQAGLFEVEILFGPDAALRLYDELRGGRAKSAPH